VEEVRLEDYMLGNRNHTSSYSPMWAPITMLSLPSPNVDVASDVATAAATAAVATDAVATDAATSVADPRVHQDAPWVCPPSFIHTRHGPHCPACKLTVCSKAFPSLNAKYLCDVCGCVSGASSKCTKTGCRNDETIEALSKTVATPPSSMPALVGDPEI